MPSGRVHDIITATTTPVVGFVSWKISGDLKTVIILMSTYFFASIMFNGDLDTISRPYKRWFIFRFIWFPYRKIFKHRSIWTHGIIIGTMIRIIYFIIIISIILFVTFKILCIFNTNIEMMKLGLKIINYLDISIFELLKNIKKLNLEMINWRVILIYILGLELGNTIHTLSDKFISAV